MSHLEFPNNSSLNFSTAFSTAFFSIYVENFGVNYNNSLSNYTFIDLFAGIGGFRLALESFGAKCVFSSEIDKDACKTYKSNFGDKPSGDITKIKENDIPPHDIICGGFPCQPFSISGKQLGFNDTKGTLFFDVARIASYHKPKILFLENVKNLLSHDKGKTFKVILNTLNNIGYDVFYKVLNASRFGVPQSRKRIYILAFRKDLNIKHFRFPIGYHSGSKLIDFCESDELTQRFIYNRPNTRLHNTNITEDLFGAYPQTTVRIGTINKGSQGDRIYSAYGHAVTLCALSGGGGAKTGLYLINNKVRKLSPRECARICGFPDNFKLTLADNVHIKQFGNTVVVNVLQHILKGLVDQLVGQLPTAYRSGSLQKLS